MVISDVIICDARGQRKGDVRIEEGVITQIGENLSGDEILKAEGCYLIPGLVDTDVRLKDSQLSRTNLEKLSTRALSGGVTTAVLSSDTHPRIDNEITLEFVQQHRYLPNGATIESTVSALNESGALSNIAIMLKKGSVAVHTATLADYNLISRIAQYLKMANKALFYKAEEKSLTESGVMSDGAVASQLGLPGISPLSEVVHVASMIEIARHFGIKIVFKSITEPRSIELITAARKAGVTVECEVAIHHLFKNDSACLGFDTDAKINPPLVNEAKRLELIDALRRGDIHSLTSLHQPNSDIHKDITFYDAHVGTTSIAEYLPLLYTYLIQKNVIDMSKLVEVASNAPAEQIGIHAGEIKVGSSIDMILFDPSQTTQVTHHHSLYKNEILQGKVIMALCRGEVTRF
ncbi:amidohydrolase family protein [Sulfuricurvum sp.]|uniref:amidohydrolase family protein n=1 Tax=Sulfuricurvum sp. TaxID=2025608 RepID=UPI00261BE836|nr:amidohydrolase family protein [Sulfuricurvum sp.]MDD2266250.1 amidohydrolase family protein [Sulfuricurvum sp.]MDD2783663.1 amidohydrolase family protein [Sulfuricurvum sp.]